MTQESALLKPSGPGLVVRDPVTREPLPAGGDLKPLDTYWTRRLADGDVERVASAPPAVKAAATPKQTRSTQE